MPDNVAADSFDNAIRVLVDDRAHGWRIDHFLSRLHPNFSRAAFQRVINEGQCFVNGLPIKMSKRLHVNDVIQFLLPTTPDHSLPPEDIPLDIIYDDDALVVINKPANMIVHPGKGNYLGTLAGALQFRFDNLSDVAGKLRAGIVHRLDRDTSGVIVVAKNNTVHANLSSQFEARSVDKEYRAITWGEVSFDRDFIETHVRVSQRNRERMMVCPPGGNSRHAATYYEVLERFDGFTYVRLCPQTGRTHQLRVHMHHLQHPVVADRLYEGHATLKLSDLVENVPPENDTVLIDRQALHAFRLGFDHPVTGKRLVFEAPMPSDFERVLAAVKQYRTKKTGKK
jgi:23S rRNA pseudouridine1911/1915/1917 synthase